jgi:TetR/AcrR family transcriptional repressor of nem operon
MRYASEHKDATRERILLAASRLLRGHGIAAAGLAKIMAEADLTVGTFYTHFASKEALLREALLRTFDTGTLQLARAAPDRAESDAIPEAGVRAAIRLAT